MSGDEDPAGLIWPWIKNSLTPAQTKEAKQVIIAYSALELGREETALAVLHRLEGRREAPPAYTRRKADSAKNDWLLALAKIVNSPLCEQDEPLTRPKAAGRALKAMKDVCRTGSTKEKGFEHLERPWYASPAAARRDKSRCADYLPSRTTITSELKRFVRRLNTYASVFE